MINLPKSSVDPRYGFFVDGLVRASDCRFLVDTGSTDTLISSEVYYKIPKERRPLLGEGSIQVRQVDGSPLSVLGIAEVEIQIGRTTQSVRATFTEMRCPGILGMDFLVPTGGKLDFQTKRWSLNGEDIQCTSSVGEPFVDRVVVLENTVIPAGYEAVVPGTIVKRSNLFVGPALVEPLESGGELAKKGLVLARSLVEAGNDIVPLRVFNPGKEQRVARKGTTVGVICQVEHDLIEGNPGLIADPPLAVPGFLSDLYERGTASVDSKYHEKVKKCLCDFRDVFSSGDHDISRTEDVRHHIQTGDARSIKERPRRQPYCNQQEIDRQVRDLEKRGVIEPSDSP